MFWQEGAVGGLGPAWTGFPQLVELEALGQSPLAPRALDVCQVAVHGASSIVRVVAQRIEPIRVLHEEGGPAQGVADAMLAGMALLQT